VHARSHSRFRLLSKLAILKLKIRILTHGLCDAVLPIDNGRATKEILSRLPVDVEYKEYKMAHEISQESLGDVSGWLRNRLDK